jgi:hypothetical protein
MIDLPNETGRAAERPGVSTDPSKKAYSPPKLERLGRWQAVTLQQSVPIFN